jgi:hypothetical protein
VETPVVRKSAMLGHCVGRLKPTGYCLYIGQGRLSCCSAYAAGVAVLRMGFQLRDEQQEGLPHEVCMRLISNVGCHSLT